MKILLTLGILLFASAIPSKADSFPTYHETGWFTITGNNSCGGPCIESVTFSFDVTFAPLPSYFPDDYKIFNIAQILGGSFTASGPLDWSSGGFPGINFDLSEEGAPYFPFVNLAGDEYEFIPDGALPLVGEIPGPLTVFGGRFFTCGDKCASEFDLPNIGNGEFAGNITSTLVTPAPETGVTTLLGIGLGIGLLGCFLKRDRMQGTVHLP